MKNKLELTERRMKAFLATNNFPSDLKAAGWRPSDLKAAGWRPSDFVSVGWRPSDFVSAGWCLSDFVSVGWRLSDFVSAGWRLSDFVSAGWRLSDFVSVGWRLSDFVSAGWRLSDFVSAGWCPSDLKAAGWRPSDLKAAGWCLSDFKAVQAEWDSIPILKKPYAHLLSDIKEGKRIHDQSTYGPNLDPKENLCGTHMCTAGHLVNMAGEIGYRLKEKYGWAVAAMLIHKKSRPDVSPQIFGAIPQEFAMAYIEERAAEEESQ